MLSKNSLKFAPFIKCGTFRAISVCGLYPNHSKPEEKIVMNTVVKDAERVVGYPTSFLSLRWILNDEIANVASHIPRLIGTNHPLIRTAKNLLLRNERATWGLIVLLLSKAAGLNAKFPEYECDRTADILHSQRTLAEVTEMIKTSHLIHSGIITIDKSKPDFADLNLGNKLALLCGDYLMSTSFTELARLKNSDIQEIISSIARDVAEGAFLGKKPTKPRASQEEIAMPVELGVAPFNIKSVLGHMKSEWVLRNILSGGSLLGKCCQCSLMLGNHGPEIQKLGIVFGRSLALAWQANQELDLYSPHFSLLSAPVMFHLEADPGFYPEIEREDVDLAYVRNVVLTGPGVEKTQRVQTEFAELALNTLDKFEHSDSKTALVNIIESM